jgi:hypothetical protein
MLEWSGSGHFDLTCLPCNGAYHPCGNRLEGAFDPFSPLRAMERPPEGQMRPATRWRAVYAMTLLNHQSFVSRKDVHYCGSERARIFDGWFVLLA